MLPDSTENVKRMLEMINKIDVVAPAEFISEVIPIRYAKATEIANALNTLSAGGGGAGGVSRGVRGSGTGGSRFGQTGTGGAYGGTPTPGFGTPPGTGVTPGAT